MSRPAERGFRRRMFEIWLERRPDWQISEQGLMNQKRAIEKNNLLTLNERTQIAERMNSSEVTQPSESAGQQQLNIIDRRPR